MNEISFRQLDLNVEADVSQFKSLHNTLFRSTNISFEWIKWYTNLIKGIRVYGAFSEKMLVGIWCVEPRSLLSLEKIGSNRDTILSSSIGRCFSVGIHPSFQRRGIFVSLSKHAIASEKSIGQYKHILGFPQFGRSVIDGHLKAGWEHCQDIDIMSYAPNVVDDDASMSRVNKIEKFGEACSIGNFYFDSNYRNGRWLEHPDHHYICIGRRSAHLVAKPYGDSCHILDFDGQLEDVVSLLETVKTLAKKHNWKELNLWCATNSRFHNVVKSCGFVQGSQRGSSIKLLSVRISSTEKFTVPECNFQMCVEEPY